MAIRIRRGLSADLPLLEEAELGYSTDKKEVHIGNSTAINTKIYSNVIYLTGVVSPFRFGADHLEFLIPLTTHHTFFDEGRPDGGQATILTAGIKDKEGTLDSNFTFSIDVHNAAPTEVGVATIRVIASKVNHLLEYATLTYAIEYTQKIL